MEKNNMNDSKNLMVVKESFFKKMLNKIKSLFKKEEFVEETQIQEKVNVTNYQSETMNRNRDFLDSIRVVGNSEMVYLKIKLENGEVKAIDLTDEQIDELQKIYDKEIEEKKNKILKLKNVKIVECTLFQMQKLMKFIVIIQKKIQNLVEI